MRGSKTRRGNSWRLIVSAGRDPITGRPRQITKTIPPKDGKPVGVREADRQLARFVAEVTGRYANNADSTLAALLAAYLDNRPNMSPSTRQDFQGFIRRLPNRLLDTRIKAVTPHTLDQLYRHLADQGGVDGQPLSPATVRRVHTILHAAFNQAVRWGWLDRNPAALASPPENPRDEPPIPTADEVAAILHAVNSHEVLRLFVPLLVATGARPGELCALTWGDVDLEAGRLRIARSAARGQGGVTVKGTKTGRVRRLRLDPQILTLLAEHRGLARQAAFTVGCPLDDWPLFPSGSSVWRPDSMSREFRTVRDSIDAPKTVTLRNLRHFVASILLAEGVDVRTVAGRLGHGANVTLAVYSHVIEQADDAAAVVVGRVLGR